MSKYEYVVFREYFQTILTGIQTSVCDVANKCFARGVIAESVHRSVVDGVKTPGNKTLELLTAVGDQIQTDVKIHQAPSKSRFEKFVGILEEEAVHEELATTLRDACLRKEKESQASLEAEPKSNQSVSGGQEHSSLPKTDSGIVLELSSVDIEQSSLSGLDELPEQSCENCDAAVPEFEDDMVSAGGESEGKNLKPVEETEQGDSNVVVGKETSCPPSASNVVVEEETSSPPGASNVVVGKETSCPPSASNVVVGKETSCPPSASNVVVGKETSSPPSASNVVVGKETSCPPSASNVVVGKETSSPPSASNVVVGKETACPPSASNVVVGKETACPPSASNIVVGKEMSSPANDLVKKLLDAASEARELCTEKEKLMHERDDVSEQLLRKEQQLKQMELKFKQTQQKRDSEVKSYQNKTSELCTIISSKEQRIRTLLHDLEVQQNLSDENEQLSEGIAELHKSLSLEKSQKEEAERELQAIQAECVNNDARHISMQQQLKEEMSKLEKERDQLKEERDSLRRKSAHQERIIAELVAVDKKGTLIWAITTITLVVSFCFVIVIFEIFRFLSTHGHCEL